MSRLRLPFPSARRAGTPSDRAWLSAVLLPALAWPAAASDGVTYGTYLGGSFLDRAEAVARTSDGDLVLTGSTASPTFPVTAGAFDTVLDGFTDAFVLRLDPVTGIEWATFLGGDDTSIFEAEAGHDVAVAPDGTVLVVGVAASDDFPTTPGAFQPSPQGGRDAFVARLAADGTLLWSTRLGAAGVDTATTVAVDAAGRPVVAGHTTSSGFPVTPGAFDEVFDSIFNTNDAFVARLASDGSALEWSTFAGGLLRDEARALALTPGGDVVVTGLTGSADFPATPGAFDVSFGGAAASDTDAFVLRLAADGSALVWATFLGGTARVEALGLGLAADADPVVGGFTESADFPVTGGPGFAGGAADAFVTRLASDGSRLVWSRLAGGSGRDEVTAVALTTGDETTLAGTTSSPDLLAGLSVDPGERVAGAGAGTAGAPSPGGPVPPLAPGGAFAEDRGLDGASDGFLLRLAAGGPDLLAGTYLGGGSDEEIAGLVLDGVGAAWVSGRSDSADFPVTPGAVDETFAGFGDAVLARVSLPPIALLGDAEAGGVEAHLVAPRGIVQPGDPQRGPAWGRPAAAGLQGRRWTDPATSRGFLLELDVATGVPSARGWLLLAFGGGGPAGRDGPLGVLGAPSRVVPLPPTGPGGRLTLRLGLPASEVPRRETVVLWIAVEDPASGELVVLPPLALRVP